MRKFILGFLPLALAILTIILIKPSDEKCRKLAVETLAASNIQAAPSNIVVKDYVVLKVLHYAGSQDTVRMGNAGFLQVDIDEEDLERVRGTVKK